MSATATFERSLDEDRTLYRLSIPFEGHYWVVVARDHYVTVGRNGKQSPMRTDCYCWVSDEHGNDLGTPYSRMDVDCFARKSSAKLLKVYGYEEVLPPKRTT